MLALPLLSLLALTSQAEPAKPPVGTVLLQQTGLSETEEIELTVRLHRALAEAGLSIDQSSAQKMLAGTSLRSHLCVKEADCARAVGKELRLPVVVGFELAATRKSFALHLEAVQVSNGKRLAVRDVVGQREGFWTEASESVSAFAKEVNAALASVTDLPREVKLEPPAPANANSAPELVASAPAREGGSLRLILGGGAVAAGVAAVALGVAGYVLQHQVALDSQGRVTSKWQDAQGSIDNGKGAYIAAGSAAAVAAGLAAAALLIEETP